MTRSRSRALAALLLALGLAPAGAAAQSDTGPSILGLLEVAGRTVTPNAELLGELGDSDFLVPTGHRVQGWLLRGNAGDAIRIDLSSSDFDPYLYLVGPGLETPLTDDDGGIGLNSQLCASLPASGEFRVVAASLGSRTGRYSLRVTPTSGSGCGDGGTGGQVSDLSALPTEGRVLSIGGTEVGTLPSFAPTYFGSPVQGWALPVQAGATVTVELRSEAFDSYLMLAGPGIAEPLTDDDGAGGCNSRITFTASATGTHQVVVSSLGSGTGPFTLSARSGEGGAPESQPCRPPSTSTATVASDGPGALPVRGRLDGEATVSGELTSSDPSWIGAPTHAWLLAGRAGERIQIDHASDDFDAYLGFAGPGFDPPARDDDGGDGLASRLCVELPEDGEYRVLASALSGGSTGRYTLAVSRALGATCTPLTLSAAQREAQLAGMTPVGALQRDLERSGSLDDSDPMHPDRGGPMEVWTFDARGGERLAFDLFSNEFDTYVYVTGPGIAEPLADDDGGSCTNSILWVDFPAAGTYRVVATSFGSSGRGAYGIVVTDAPNQDRPCGTGGTTTTTTTATTADATDLSMAVVTPERRLPRPEAAGLPAPAGTRPLQVGGLEVTGTLRANDPVREGNRHVQGWSLEARAGDRYLIELVSTAFDPYLFVDGPGIVSPLADDDGGAGLNARIDLEAPESGSYRILVTAFGAGATGDFTLRVLRLP